MSGSRIHHVALYVSDIRDKLYLLQQVFGMKITELQGEPENPGQVWLDGGVQLIAAPEENRCKLAHLALTTESIEETSKALQQQGANVLPRGNSWLQLTDQLVIELMPEETLR